MAGKKDFLFYGASKWKFSLLAERVLWDCFVLALKMCIYGDDLLGWAQKGGEESENRLNWEIKVKIQVFVGIFDISDWAMKSKWKFSSNIRWNLENWAEVKKYDRNSTKNDQKGGEETGKSFKKNFHKELSINFEDLRS